MKHNHLRDDIASYYGKASLYWLLRLENLFSTPGLLTATLFFAASLTPSLIPRTYVMQGVLSGVSLAAGYAIGVFGHWLWAYLELPEPRERIEAIIKLVATVICATIALVFLGRASEWQNSSRVLMEMEPVDSAHPFKVGAIAIAVFIVLHVLGRLFRLTVHISSEWLKQHIPRRISNLVGVVAAVALFWSLVDGVLIKYGMRMADASYQKFDSLVESNVSPPLNPIRTGSAASLLDWDQLGRTGRQFVSWGPRRARLSAFFNGERTLDPIRVYVGLNSAETVEERVELALQELKRVNAFDRSVLVIATPTGKGMVDEGAINSLEYLHRGDVATVAVQYSYLASWLSLLVEPDYGAETAQVLFNKIYDHWTQLPKDERPKLYLYGLSLGALNSQLSADIYDVVGDPIQGALWAGPPFASERWQNITKKRMPWSPAWLPVFREGSTIRFMNQWDTLETPNARWGPIRFVYLQYASDPVTFFDPEAFYRAPPWMTHPRGPDVSRELRWYPIVTQLQLTVDIAAADEAPLGYGHRYAPEDYIDAWVAVTAPEGWSEEEIERLKSIYKDWR
ncbi:alpha/beta hydrolase [Chelativorans salis]|uniref:Alpha/beta-hydrolase family protein n=1 Tax=Chelativorans salis TaxID=2978478 RepID=A0ABT2LTV6_9HYPH|nr:alpha/beta-hydrolase family protein [Chelativorans sp. EGI FJ00035]MCT7377934.1 alpha/beta-hydrolase family protein [Chelativorans sp. EGI FJ00035]